MKRKTFFIPLILLGSTLCADTIHDWLDAAHKAPNQHLYDLPLSSAKLQSDAATAALYPKVS
ncbi:MAG: hypothetical protein IE883_05220, partial [Epsilonproteobacteria bacterium]|nr:hypothetical protein [Campylobacterota bacterium]